MYIKKNSGYVLRQTSTPFNICKGRLDVFIPQTSQSLSWKCWKAVIDLKLCQQLKERMAQTIMF